MAGFPRGTINNTVKNQIELGKFFRSYETVEELDRDVEVLEKWYSFGFINSRDYNGLKKAYNYTREKLNSK